MCIYNSWNIADNAEQFPFPPSFENCSQFSISTVHVKLFQFLVSLVSLKYLETIWNEDLTLDHCMSFLI